MSGRLLRLIPRLARTFLFALAFAGPGVRAAAAETLGEAQIIERAVAVDPQLALARARTALAERAVDIAGQYPDPRIGWGHEMMPGAGGEHTVTLQVPLDFSGRRAARRALAEAEVAMAAASALQRQSRVVHLALTLGYAIQAGRQSIAIVERTVGRFEQAAHVLRRRVEEGSAAGWELDRLVIELELLRSRVQQERQALVAQRIELAALLGLAESGFELGLQLGPQAELIEVPERPPVLAWQDKAALAAGRAGQRQRSFAWPTISLQAGALIGVGTNRGFGYVAGLQLPIPMFSRGRRLRLQVETRRQTIVSGLAVALRDRRLLGAQATAQFEMATAELTRFDRATEGRVERVERAVSSGYREGERTIVEWIDAQQTRAAVESRGLALQHQAKQAELRLRAARGEFER